MDAVGILLAGGLRHSMLRRQTGCAIGSLPITEQSTLLGAWLERIGADPRIRKVLVVTSDEPDREILQQVASTASLDCEVESILDPTAHRGTGGVLSDVVAELSCDLFLVCEVSAVPPRVIDKAIMDVVETGDAVMSVGISELQRPIGIFSMLRMAFDRVPHVGYYDLKEQLIPALVQSGHMIRPVTLMPRHIRMEDLEGWLAAVRAMGGGVHPEARIGTGVRMEGSVCVLKDAFIEDSASIRDSLIMEGACIEADAVVARSVVGPGMTIRRGNRIIDGILMNTFVKDIDVNRIAPTARGTGRLAPVRVRQGDVDEDALR